jgi:8-oxo-dGTP pyrophosphatase MutT (NUDIX family)
MSYTDILDQLVKASTHEPNEDDPPQDVVVNKAGEQVIMDDDEVRETRLKSYAEKAGKVEVAEGFGAVWHYNYEYRLDHAEGVHGEDLVDDVVDTPHPVKGPDGPKHSGDRREGPGVHEATGEEEGSYTDPHKVLSGPIPHKDGKGWDRNSGHVYQGKWWPAHGAEHYELENDNKDFQHHTGISHWMSKIDKHEDGAEAAWNAGDEKLAGHHERGMDKVTTAMRDHLLNTGLIRVAQHSGGNTDFESKMSDENLVSAQSHFADVPDTKKHTVQWEENGAAVGQKRTFKVPHHMFMSATSVKHLERMHNQHNSSKVSQFREATGEEGEKEMTSGTSGTTPYKAAVAIVLKWDRDGAAKVLLGASTATDDRSGRYCFPGGGIDDEDGGDPLKAAIREAYEEAAVKVDAKQVIDYPPKKGVAFVVCPYQSGDPEPNSEFKTMQWFPCESLESLDNLHSSVTPVLWRVTPSVFSEKWLEETKYSRLLDEIFSKRASCHNCGEKVGKGDDYEHQGKSVCRGCNNEINKPDSVPSSGGDRKSSGKSE